ncbi:MAG: hypothetical protein ACQET7_06625 [Thermodesulfobacteriota bacterium]
MKPRNQPAGSILFMILAVPLFITACASVHQVRVDYRLPGPSRVLEGKAVFINFQDGREDRELLGPGAREAYKYYSGNVSLFVARDGEPPSREGLKDVPSLFRDVFARRIRTLGGEAAPERKRADAELVIHLKAFSLDLEDRKWVARMAYEIRLVGDGRVRTRQEVSGEAERVRIIGFKQADQVMGELFTDIVNRPDLPALFKEAGL